MLYITSVLYLTVISQITQYSILKMNTHTFAEGKEGGNEVSNQ